MRLFCPLSVIVSDSRRARPANRFSDSGGPVDQRRVTKRPGLATDFISRATPGRQLLAMWHVSHMVGNYVGLYTL